MSDGEEKEFTSSQEEEKQEEASPPKKSNRGALIGVILLLVCLYLFLQTGSSSASIFDLFSGATRETAKVNPEVVIEQANDAIPKEKTAQEDERGIPSSVKRESSFDEEKAEKESEKVSASTETEGTTNTDELADERPGHENREVYTGSTGDDSVEADQTQTAGPVSTKMRQSGVKEEADVPHSLEHEPSVASPDSLNEEPKSSEQETGVLSSKSLSEELYSLEQETGVVSPETLSEKPSVNAAKASVRTQQEEATAGAVADRDDAGKVVEAVVHDTADCERASSIKMGHGFGSELTAVDDEDRSKEEALLGADDLEVQDKHPNQVQYSSEEELTIEGGAAETSDQIPTSGSSAEPFDCAKEASATMAHLKQAVQEKIVQKSEKLDQENGELSKTDLLNDLREKLSSTGGEPEDVLETESSHNVLSDLEGKMSVIDEKGDETQKKKKRPNNPVSVLGTLLGHIATRPFQRRKRRKVQPV